MRMLCLRRFATLAALAGSGCSVILPTGDYTDGLPSPDAGSMCGSAMPAPSGYEPSSIIFQDSFCGTTLDTSKWAAYEPGFSDRGQLTVPLSGPNSGSFYSQYWSPSQVTVNGGLTLTAVPDTTQTGYTAKSGVLTTTDTVKFVGGPMGRTYLQIRAKVPATNGMWPIVSLGQLVGVNPSPITVLSTGFTDTMQGQAGELKDFEVGASGVEAYGSTNTDLSAGFTDYGVEIVWGRSVTWFWNRLGASPQMLHHVEAGDAGVSIPTSGAGETLIIQLNVFNGEGGNTWHTVWNGTDSDSFQMAAIQVYAR